MCLKGLETIAQMQQKRDGPTKSAVKESIRSSITAQSMDRHEEREGKEAKKKARRQSVALVNALKPHMVEQNKDGSIVGASQAPVAYQVRVLVFAFVSFCFVFFVSFCFVLFRFLSSVLLLSCLYLKIVFFVFCFFFFFPGLTFFFFFF